MSKNTKEQEIPYSYLVDNIKIFLIFLVVFNHIIAFQLVKADQVVRFVWYGITYFICRRSYLFPVICPRSLRM